jgi:glycosyltransferase involved in cell wall biosynthesis
MIGLEYVRYQVSRRLSCIIQSFNPQLLHAHCLIPAGSYVIGKQLPTLVTAHGSDAYDWPWQRPGLRRLAESVANSATIIVAVSNFIRRHVERLGRSTVEVVFNGADDTVFSPAHREAARAKLGIKLNRPVVAFAGSLARSKGVFDLVAATEKLHDLVPLLVIIGEGPQSAGLKRFLDQARIEYRLCGVLTQSEIATAFGAADIVALPSYREGLPVVVCEAMLAGRAVLSTPVGGIPEIIADYETGRLVPAGDVEALSSALRELYLNPELKQKLEQQARNFAAAHLTWRANAARYDRLYSDTLSRFSNSGRRLVS